MSNTEKIQKVTSKGQITLPIAWRRKVGNASAIVIRTEGDTLHISPLLTEDDKDAEWITLFDAMRDNNGKGLPVEAMIRVIKKSIAKDSHHGLTR